MQHKSKEKYCAGDFIFGVWNNLLSEVVTFSNNESCKVIIKRDLCSNDPCNVKVETENQLLGSELVDSNNLPNNPFVPHQSLTNRKTRQSNEDIEDNEFGDSSFILPAIIPARSCVCVPGRIQSSPNHQLLNVPSDVTHCFCGNIQSGFAEKEGPTDSKGRRPRQKLRKSRPTLTEISPVSSGRGSRHVLLSHLLYKMLAILMLAFPAALCDQACTSSRQSHDRLYFDCHCLCCVPALNLGTMVFRQSSNTSWQQMSYLMDGILEPVSNEPNGTCILDVFCVNVTGRIDWLEGCHWLSISSVACCSHEHQLAGHHWPLIQSSIWHAPVKRHFNYSCGSCLEACKQHFHQASLLSSQMHLQIWPARFHAAEIPHNFSYVVVTIPVLTMSQSSAVQLFQPCGRRLELLCYWFNSPSDVRRAETRRQRMNALSQIDSGEACPLISIELPIILHSLALLFVCLMIDRRYPLVDAEEMGELDVGGMEPEGEQARIGTRVGVQPISDPLPSNIVLVYHRQSGHWPHPHATDEPSEDTDDSNTSYSNNFAPPSAMELDGTPLSIAATTEPVKTDNRKPNMLSQDKPMCVPTSLWKMEVREESGPAFHDILPPPVTGHGCVSTSTPCAMSALFGGSVPNNGTLDAVAMEVTLGDVKKVDFSCALDHIDLITRPHRGQYGS